ncbi:MAG: methionyl aminopeptidase [Rhabdochlamydiaceae bacterium]|nr:methionyl aminopeptidase [Candidatus Amphrikana amoebophyrae]
MISRNDPCWCGSGQKWKKCHYPKQPIQTFDVLKREYKQKHNILLKTPEEIDKIRAASRLAAHILDELCKAAVEGVTTQQLDDLCMKLHKKHNAKPAPLNYGSPPYPKSICTSLNEVVCHGIPDERPLQNGDILNIDVTSILDGYFGDNSRMVCIGKVDAEKQLVVDTSYNCLMESIAILKPGVLLNEIGNVIESVARKAKCSVVYQFVGHGHGIAFHEEPQIYHSYNNIKIPLVEGMTFTIEPMINAGVPEAKIDKKDGWTARTADLKPSAQWEHTVLITKDGHEILTLLKKN